MTDDRFAMLEPFEALVLLGYELLDAHDDTARLVAEHEHGMRWSAHLAYLRDLQRVGRELLARTTAPGRQGSRTPLSS